MLGGMQTTGTARRRVWRPPPRSWARQKFGEVKKAPKKAGGKQRGSDWSSTFLQPGQVPEPRLDFASKPSGGARHFRLLQLPLSFYLSLGALSRPP